MVDNLTANRKSFGSTSIVRGWVWVAVSIVAVSIVRGGVWAEISLREVVEKVVGGLSYRSH